MAIIGKVLPKAIRAVKDAIITVEALSKMYRAKLDFQVAKILSGPEAIGKSEENFNQATKVYKDAKGKTAEDVKGICLGLIHAIPLGMNDFAVHDFTRQSPKKEQPVESIEIIEIKTVEMPPQSPTASIHLKTIANNMTPSELFFMGMNQYTTK